MKQIAILLLIIITGTSITKKANQEPCDCQQRVTMFLNGKLVHVDTVPFTRLKVGEPREVTCKVHNSVHKYDEIKVDPYTEPAPKKAF